jgi:hypothetical protein
MQNINTGIGYNFFQMLSSEDHGEITVIQNSIMTLFRKDPPGAIMGLFSQVSYNHGTHFTGELIQSWDSSHR